MYYLTTNFRDDAPDVSDEEEEVLVRADPGHFAEDLAAPEGRAGIVVKLTLEPALYPLGWSEIERQNHRILFRRFVDLLVPATTEAQNPPRRRLGALSIRAFKIGGAGFPPRWFGLDGPYREEDVERLFRDVLPNHPTIERIQLAHCQLCARHVSLLVSSIPAGRATPLLELSLDFRHVHPSCLQEICDMLRWDVPLRAMSLIGVPSEDCRLIFQSLAANTYLPRRSCHRHQGSAWRHALPCL
jgi:hypothetical protein